MTPFSVENKRGPERTIQVPCGKCPNCLARRVSGWSFRLMQEEKRSHSAHFLTLTYDTLHVPITKNGFMNLKKKDLQDFFKRLRKAHGKDHPKISYYAVGEYGGKTKRPHYHIIMFNARVELVQESWKLDGKYIGDIHYGEVTGASVGYTLKYMSKPSKIPLHINDDRQREFALMSKGLGENYLTKAMQAWHKADLINRMYCNLHDGKKISMPRYYKEKLYTEMQRKRIAHFAMVEAAKKQKKEMEKQGDAYWSNKASKDTAAFKKMHYKAENSRNKI